MVGSGEVSLRLRLLGKQRGPNDLGSYELAATLGNHLGQPPWAMARSSTRNNEVTSTVLFAQGELGITDFLPAILAGLLTLLIVIAVRFIVHRRSGIGDVEARFRSQLASVGVVLVGLLVIVFLLPEESNSDLAFSIVGLIVTGALAISSQSIIANAMAGLMLRTVSSFKLGDFIEVADNIGRVTERGLFHTEIQTADRDLITLPNSLMVNQPVRVVLASGTIVSATASLGYDVSRHTLEELFVTAAESAGLIEPFVQVIDLGDYSVNYRIAGFLEDPRSLLAARSRLRSKILDTLSEAGIEIMSPTYIARRVVSNDPLLPDDDGTVKKRYRRTAESRVFDKAEGAAILEETKVKLVEATENLELLRLEVHNEDSEIAERAVKAVERAERRIELLEGRIENLVEAQQQE